MLTCSWNKGVIMSKQCNPKCFVCTFGPKQNEEIMSFEWLKTELNSKGKLEFRSYAPDKPAFDFGSNDILGDLFKNKNQAPAYSDRFGWVHKTCIENIGNMMRNMKEMIRVAVELEISKQKINP